MRKLLWNLFVLTGLLILNAPLLQAAPMTPVAGDPSGRGILPQFSGAIPSPSDLGFDFGLEISFEGELGITRSFALPDGFNQIDIVADSFYLNWSSTLPIGAVILVGNDLANIYAYEPEPCLGDTLLHAPLTNNDSGPSPINQVAFAWNQAAATPVPEPSTLVLFALGLLGVVGSSRKGRTRNAG